MGDAHSIGVMGEYILSAQKTYGRGLDIGSSESAISQ